MWVSKQIIKKIFLLLLVLTSVQAYAAVDIVVNEIDTPDPVPAGGVLTYTINVANNGPDDATGVRLTSVLPVGVTLQSVTSDQGTCSGTTTITCLLGAIDNNLSANVVIKVVVPNTAGDIFNTFTSTRDQVDSNSFNDGKVERTTVVQSADLQMTKTDSANPILQGKAYNYVLAVKNLGPFVHTNTSVVTVTDSIPASMRLTSVPTGTNWTCTSSGGATFPQNGPVTVTCTIPVQANNQLAVNASFGNITVPVLALSSGTVTNEATVSSTMPDKNTGNNTGTKSTTVTQAEDLSVAKVLTNTSGSTIGTGTQLSVGQTYRYSVTPSLVIGDTTPATVRVTDTLPNNIQVTTLPTVSNIAGTWTCAYSPAQTLPFVVSSGNPVSMVCDSSTAYSNSATTSKSLANFTFDFNATQGGTITNAAAITTISPNLTDITAGNNSTSVTHTVNAASDLQITKTINGSGTTRALNSVANYTLAYRNAGTSDIPVGTTVTVNDNLPAGVQITSITAPAGWTCPAASAGSPINGPTTITCTRSGLAVAGNANIVLAAKFTTTGTKLNTADISPTAGDPNTGNNNSSNQIDVVDTTGGGGVWNDLAILKDDTVAGNATYGPDPVAVTGNVRYRLRITNNGPAAVPNARVITVTDMLPPNSSFVSVTAPAGWICSNTATVITCTRSTGFAIGFADIDVVIKATNGTTMTNNAAVNVPNDPIGSNNTAAQQTNILDDANLKLTKTASATSINRGQNITYTFKVENLGQVAIPAGAGGAIRLNDTMNTNPGATYVSNTGAANGWTCNAAVNPFTCSFNGGLAVNAASTFTVTVTPTTEGLGRPNTASVGFTGPSLVVADPDSSNNTSTVNIDVLPMADMQITKSASLATVAVGQNLTYVLTAKNNGLSTATNAKVIDTLPNNLTVLSITPTGTGTCQQNVPSAGQIQCVWATMASGSTQSATIVVRPTKPAENTTIINQASISSDVSDTVSGNNTASVSTNVTPAVIDLLVSKTDAVDPIAQNGTVVYTVSVNNLGPSVATNVVLTENLPSTYLDFIDATPQQGTCNAPDATHKMLCSLGDIQAGQTVNITIRMLARAIGTDTNNVSAAATEQESNVGNNSATENTTVQLGADVQVTKSVDDTFVFVNIPFPYKLHVFNQGPANSNVTLTDVIPAGMSYQSYTTTQGTCSYNNTNNTITCTLGRISVGGSTDIIVNVIPRQLGAIGNTANVTGTAPETATNNNQSSVTVTSQLMVSGRVFNDNGGSVSNISTNAYNGIQDTGEQGIGNSTIQLTDCASTVIAQTTTNAAGDYQFISSTNLPNPYCIVETNVQGYTSVSGVSGYTRSSDRISVANPTPASYVGGNFGDASLNVALTESGQHTVIAGSVTDYPHRLVAQAPVQLTQLTQINTQQPAVVADQQWQAIVYRDSNCNGTVDAGEIVFNPSVSSPLLLQPAADICLVQRVHAPSNVRPGAEDFSQLQASFTVALTTPNQTISGATNQQSDTTLIGTAGLDLQKRVRVVANCPSNDPSTTGFVTNNLATNLDKLEYEITYRNNSVKKLQNVTIKDMVPVGTNFGSVTCEVTPTGNTCTPSNNNGALAWQLAGDLLPASTGKVRFCVQQK